MPPLPQRPHIDLWVRPLSNPKSALLLSFLPSFPASTLIPLPWFLPISHQPFLGTPWSNLHLLHSILKVNLLRHNPNCVTIHYPSQTQQGLWTRSKPFHGDLLHLAPPFSLASVINPNLLHVRATASSLLREPVRPCLHTQAWHRCLSLLRTPLLPGL